MGDMGDFFRDIKQHTKDVKKQRLEYDGNIIRDRAKISNFDLEMVEYYHFRLRKKFDGNFIDIFPMKKRWFNSKTKQWGNYQSIDHLLNAFAKTF